MHLYTIRKALLALSVTTAGCFKDGDFLAGPAGGRAERVIEAGTVDTLRLPASGVYLEVDATAVTIPLTVRLQQVAQSIVPQAVASSPTVALEIYNVVPGRALVPAREAGNPSPNVSAGLARLTIYFKTSPTAVLNSVVLRPTETAGGTVTFWTSPTTTTYVDPRTGESQTVAATTLTLPTNEISKALLVLASTPSACSEPREFTPVDGGIDPGEKIPLVLIHGWQPLMWYCDADPAHESLDLSYEGYRDKTFIKLLAYLKSGDRLGLLQRYKIYALRYPTFENVLQSSQFLKEQLASLASKGAKPPVLLGHSMGGLVARGLLTLPGAPPIRGILTLGTPHEGTPFGAVSNGTSSIPEKRWIDAAAACRTPKWALSLFVNDFPPSNGTADLDPAGAFISFLKGNRIGQDRIFSFAGQLTAGDLIDHPIYARLACMLGYLDNTLASDGVVPVASAAPGWTALQAILQHHTHEGMHDGRPGDELFTRIGDVLDRLSRCEATTPTPPGRNDIILSGSVARINARQVDVTLNAIIVDGVVQRNLTKSNFQIIENGCSLDSGTFEITTGTGSVGVDLVFAQDLSGSMGSAISGVRTSVISFAQSLASRGLSVQFGSIGYSGPGRIPTTPPTSSCEFLGPFEQLTSAAAFQAHVQSSWLLGSGCDFPENGLEAIEYAHQHVDWRPGAARVYIDITDASHHTTTTDCNLAGPCTDETLTSITTLLGGTSVIHAVASADVFDRTGDGGLDPWLLANATGGQRLVLPDNGIVDLNALTIADVIGQTVRLTFTSASAATAPLNLRVRVTINGKVGEFSPGLLTYAPIHVSLSR